MSKEVDEAEKLASIMRTAMKQSRKSILEDPDYSGMVTALTLVSIARSLERLADDVHELREGLAACPVKAA